MNLDKDIRQRFIFEASDIRGEILSLQDSYQAALLNGNYPPPVAELLGEFMAGVCLLSATLKFDGIISLQASGKGPLAMIMADCTRHHNVRGVARYEQSRLAATQAGSSLNSSQHLSTVLGTNATLAVTIDPANGKRYQGIIPLEGTTLSECLITYFDQSEQLPTKIRLHADGHRAGGLLLQALPPQRQALAEREEYWHHLSHLTDTLTAAEQLCLPHATQLHRLFHEEPLRLFEPLDIRVACSCSKTRTANALLSLGLAEVTALLKEKSPIEMTCQFCHQQYCFDENDVKLLFSQSVSTLH